MIEARDERVPPRVAHVLLRVSILDANDNAPMFVKQPYMAIVSLDTIRGQQVLKVGIHLFL